MATIPADLFVRYVPGEPLDPAHNRLLFNQLGGTPTIPPLTAGDTIAAKVYFLDQGNSQTVPFRGHRYAGATVKLRLRAAGNATDYALATASSEIAPATGVTVTRLQAGNIIGQVEIQQFTFGSIPLSGTFKINFFKPNSHNSSSSLSRRPGLSGTTISLPVSATAADVRSAMQNIKGFYLYDTGGNLKEPPLTFAEYVAAHGEEGRTPIITKLSNGFTIQFGTLRDGGGGNFYNSWIDSIPLITVDISDVQFGYGWNVDLPLTHATFNDLFLFANAPAYLEVLLTPSGGGEAMAAQYLLTSQSGTGGEPPDPPPGSGGPPANVDGITYDGDHFSAPWAVGILRSETPFPQAPGYHVFRQRYRWVRGVFVALALSTPCPQAANAFLVEEGERMDLGGADLIEYDRVWAHIPPTLIDGEMVDYVWQTIGTINGAAAIQSIPLTRWATRTRTFHHTTNPAGIPKLRLPRAGVFAGIGLTFDGFVNLYGGTVTIARDDKVERWMGNIWVKTHWDITI